MSSHETAENENTNEKSSLYSIIWMIPEMILTSILELSNFNINQSKTYIDY